MYNSAMNVTRTLLFFALALLLRVGCMVRLYMDLQRHRSTWINIIFLMYRDFRKRAQSGMACVCAKHTRTHLRMEGPWLLWLM